MKNLIIFLWMPLLAGMGLFADHSTGYRNLPNLVDYALNCFASEQKSQNLNLVNKIFDVDDWGNITRLGYLFDLYDTTLDIPRARNMITGIVTSFVDRISQNEKLKPYLHCFTEKNVVVRIRLRNDQCGFIYPKLGNVAYVSAIDGIVVYDTLNSYTYDLDTLQVENYTSAISLPRYK